jgi:hypothetical protein
MSMARKIVLSSLLLMFMPMFALGQTQATVTVDGATDPNGIPDNVAYLASFRALVAATTTTEATKISYVGFSDSDDATTLTNVLAGFSLRQDGEQTGADLLTLAETTEASLESQLTPTGVTQWQTFAKANRPSMKLYAFGGNCSGSIYTYFEGYVDGYTDTGVDSELYGDAAYIGGCTCNIAPTMATLLYGGTSNNGSKSATAEWVSRSGIPMSAGAVHTVNFSFLWADCGTVYIVRLIFSIEFANGSGEVTQVTRNTAAGMYAYALVDNCNPQGDIIIGGNTPNVMLDTVRTDGLGVELSTLCVSPDGFKPWKCFVPGAVWLPAQIGNRNDDVPDGFCTDH